MRPPPVVWLVLALGAGLATGLARFSDPRLSIPVLLAATLLARRRDTLGLCLGAVLVGQLLAAVAWVGEGGRCTARLRPGAITLTLLPIDPPPVERGRVEAEVVGAGCRGNVVVRWPAGATVEVGVALRAEGRWIPRPDGPFDRPGGTLVVRSAQHATRNTPHTLSVRRALLATTARLYGDRAPLVDALLFDRQGAIDRDTRDRFAASGLVHLLSISGFHVGLIIGWLFLVGRGLRLSRERALVAATLCGVVYVAWIGWPAPATRAAALAAILCLARLRQRSVRWDALLAATSLAVLLVDPWAIAELGAWLSVGSLAGATYASRWSDLRFGTGALARTLSGSAGATFATAPITAGAVGSVSVAGLLLNFVGIPVAAVAVPAVILSLLAAPLAPPVATAMAAGGGALLAALDRLAAFGATIPFGHFVMEAGPEAALPWAALLGVLLWVISSRATREVALTRAAVAIGCGLWAGSGATLWRGASAAGAPALTLTFLDVGQGDATAIATPHGHWIVVDAGPEGEGRDAGRGVVVPFLQRHGVARLEALMLSHAHRDHYGGMPAVLDRIPVARFLEPGEVVDDPGYRMLLDRVAESGAAWHPFRRGDTLRVDGVELIALHPDTAWGDWGLDLNEDSDVLLVRYGAFRALLAGDAGLPAEADMRHAAGDVDVLKVGHHGSAGASGTE
ncbi:MAG TPA: ComEC/Rec2 family competence protein [Gemmatimonadales bacterium]|nr:ComEC/Rec2 family competence protein [Gemmatimonadales bacterium]